jgi:TetR/AcrR family transcriptional repressor of uid operon
VPKITEAARTARRQQIIEAGLTCFAKSGYHAATMADVAVQAGVSKGTPYLYFESKQALFLALYSEWECGAQQRIDATIGALTESERNSPRRILRAIAAGIAAQVLAESEACRVLMEASTLAGYDPSIATTVRQGDAQTHGRLAELIAAGVKAGEWPDDTDPALAARLFTAGLYGLMAQWHTDPGSFGLPEAAQALANQGAPR